MGRVIAMVFDGTSSAQSQSQHVSEDPAIFYGRSTKTVLCEQRRHTLCQGKKAEAVPAESNGPQRKTDAAYVALYINYEGLKATLLDGASKSNGFRWDEQCAVPVPVPKLTKNPFHF